MGEGGNDRNMEGLSNNLTDDEKLARQSMCKLNE